MTKLKVRSRYDVMTTAEVEEQVRDIVDPLPRELLLHLLKERHRLAIIIDPEKGEVLQRIRDSVADRLHAILEDTDAPRGEEDLLFIYRDRHGRARMDNIRDSLRTHLAAPLVGRYWMALAIPAST